MVGPVSRLTARKVENTAVVPALSERAMNMIQSVGICDQSVALPSKMLATCLPVMGNVATACAVQGRMNSLKNHRADTRSEDERGYDLQSQEKREAPSEAGMIF